MPNIPSKVSSRFNKALKTFANVLENAKSRDVNENDTVRIVWDMLDEIFGYDKYNDITSEYAIRGTYCDLAIKDGNDIRYLIECKAIDTELKSNHLRQAVDYAAREGVSWAILTNGIKWEVYKIIFTKPMDFKLVFELDFLNDDVKDSKFIDRVYLLSKEAINKSAIEAYDEERQLINKHTISAILQSDETIKAIRKQLNYLSKDVSIYSIEPELIKEIIINEIIKRELVDNQQVKAVFKKLQRLSKKKSKVKNEKNEEISDEETLDGIEDIKTDINNQESEETSGVIEDIKTDVNNQETEKNELTEEVDVQELGTNNISETKDFNDKE